MDIILQSVPWPRCHERILAYRSYATLKLYKLGNWSHDFFFTNRRPLFKRRITIMKLAPNNRFFPKKYSRDNWAYLESFYMSS